MKEEEILKMKEDLVFGIKILDEQHEKVIQTLYELYKAVSIENSDDIIIQNVENLDKYVLVHFETEEQYAEYYNFPNIDKLKKEHEFFKNLYNEIRYNYFNYKLYQDKKNLKIHSLQLVEASKSWLEYHLKTLDKELCEFLIPLIQE